jgi:hypothetical protein
MPRANGKSDPISNREVVTDAICKVMHDRFRDDSIDSLLTRPVDAIEMALDVAVQSGDLSKAAVGRLVNGIRKLFRDEQGAEDLIAKICRAGLSSRKRGDLKKERY